MSAVHDDVIKWKYFPRYWPFVPRWIPSQKPVMQIFDVFFDLCRNNMLSKHRETGDLRHHHTHYGVTVMLWLEGWMLGLSKHAILLKTGWYLIPMFITIGQATWNVITQYEFLAIFVCSLPCNTWIRLYTLNTESCYYVDFVVIGGTAGCHYDNLQCHQWWQSWHHENS